MRKHLTAAAGLAIVLAGCSFGDSATPDTTSPSTSTVTAPATDEATIDASPTPDTPVNEEPATEPDSVTASPSTPATVLDPVEVDASALPADVATALRDGGGELATTADWTQRFGATELPTLEGPAVHLIEATIQMSPSADGFDLVDELQWILVASTSRDDLLDQLAGSIDLGGWNRDESISTIDGAECVARDYSSPDTSATWTLQGCNFPTLGGMVSIGVSHTTTATSVASLPFLDPSVTAVLDDIDGTVSELLVTFGSPSPASTSTLTMTLTVDAGNDDDPAGTLEDGALASWNKTSGEAGSVVFAGSPGSHWTVTNSTVQFTNEGRLAP